MEANELLIQSCLSELRKRQLNYNVYDRYYKGDHDILHNYAMQESRSNMKVVINYPKRFINEEISYILSNPINYISVYDNKDIIRQIDLNLSHWAKLVDQELLKNTQIYGESYLLSYINKDGEYRDTVLTPMNSFVLENGNAEKEVILALHIYSKLFDTKEYMDIYVDNRILHYEVNNNTLTLTGEDTHIFNGVPVTICTANSERKSMIDDIKSLNDSYNSVISDLVNESSDFRNAFLTITNAKLEEEDIVKMKKSGIIQVPETAKIDFLIKKLDDTFIQNLLTTLKEQIYVMASHIDTNEKLQSNTSSLALRSRLISLENKCSLLTAQLEAILKQRLKRLFYFLRIKNGVDFDYRTIKLKFTSNVPQDLATIGQVITQLQNTISQRTALSLLPFIENPNAELEQFNKEKQFNEGIDLDNVGGSDE